MGVVDVCGATDCFVSRLGVFLDFFVFEGGRGICRYGALVGGALLGVSSRALSRAWGGGIIGRRRGAGCTVYCWLVVGELSLL